jgi:UDP-N-acetylmuramoyl-tripeptide--D-alanyl-D-alanine ligase
MKLERLYEIFLEYPSVQTDSRKIKNGDLFFALKGPNFNGNEYATKAIESGAAYAIVDEEPKTKNDRVLVTDDVLKTLQQLARHHRRQFKIPFIAITGSNGKTTTKELVHVVLSSTFKTYTTQGNLNNHIGIPLTFSGREGCGDGCGMALTTRRDSQLLQVHATHPRDHYELW